MVVSYRTMTSTPIFSPTPQSTLSTAPLYGSLICLSLRRGAQRAEWWLRTGQHLDVTFQHYRGRPMVAPTTVFHLCSPFSLATLSRLCRQLPSMGALYASPRGEVPVGRSGGFVRNGAIDVTFQHYQGRPMVAPTTVFRLCSPFHLSTPQSTLSTAPLYGSLICLSLRRGGTKCRSGGFVDSASTSLFSNTTGDQWSPLRLYSTVQKFKKRSR